MTDATPGGRHTSAPTPARVDTGWRAAKVPMQLTADQIVYCCADGAAEAGREDFFGGRFCGFARDGSGSSVTKIGVGLSTGAGAVMKSPLDMVE